MEPELFRLARRMYEAWRARMAIESPGIPTDTWDECEPAVKRGVLAMTIEARPDLVCGMQVWHEDWSAGVLPTFGGG